MEAGEEEAAMAADFMPVEDMGRRQRTRDAEAAAERENKVPHAATESLGRVMKYCTLCISQHASLCAWTLEIMQLAAAV